MGGHFPAFFRKMPVRKGDETPRSVKKGGDERRIFANCKLTNAISHDTIRHPFKTCMLCPALLREQRARNLCETSGCFFFASIKWKQKIKIVRGASISDFRKKAFFCSKKCSPKEDMCAWCNDTCRNVWRKLHGGGRMPPNIRERGMIAWRSTW